MNSEGLISLARELERMKQRVGALEAGSIKYAAPVVVPIPVGVPNSPWPGQVGNPWPAGIGDTQTFNAGKASAE